MNPAIQNWLQVAALFFGIAGALVGTLAYQTHYIDKRIDDLRSDLFHYLDARFKALEDRLERLEHPVSR